jgi:D-alanyl-D-alanine carboxypeptidase (penicillin-binding protein 5/6)
LSVNDKITVENLLYGLMLVSGNDAAVALSEFIGNSVEGFANMMNQKAADLGLTSTHFVTPHGLDQDEHYTTAHELAKIADYALQNETFAKIVKTSNYTVTIDGNSKSLHNTNELLGYLDGVYGVKTGFTNGANRCLVTSCKRGDLDVICVVLGCDTKKDRGLDSIELINYTFNNFSVVNIKDIIDKNFNDWVSEKSHKIEVNKGVTSNLNFILDESQIYFKSIAVKKDLIDAINTSISFSEYFEAPLSENNIIGEMVVTIGDVTYLSIDILNGNMVKKKDVFNYLEDFIENYFEYFAIQ